MLAVPNNSFEINSFISNNNQIKPIPISLLVPYHNHQFKLYSGERLEDMVESIRKNGVLNPILVQPIEDGKYEVLSGHNRVEGAKLVGLEYVPAIIKENLSEDEAEIYVIETNLIQRSFSELLISEQAHVLQIQHSKMFSQGKRNDIIRELEKLEGKTTSDAMRPKLTRNTLAKDYGLGTTSVSYLIRINYLIPAFKDMIDDKILSLRAGVDLSFISENVQKMVYEVINNHNKKIDMKLSKAIRKLYNENNDVTMETLESLIIGEKQSKDTKPIKVSLSQEVYSKYFDKKTSADEIADTIQKALEMYFNNKN